MYAYPRQGGTWPGALPYIAINYEGGTKVIISQGEAHCVTRDSLTEKILSTTPTSLFRGIFREWKHNWKERGFCKKRMKALETKVDVEGKKNERKVLWEHWNKEERDKGRKGDRDRIGGREICDET